MARAALELDQDQRFQRREWRFQRVGWGVFALLVVAALLGLFGAGGPLARGHAASGGAPAVEVDFSRFVHRQTATPVQVRVAGPLAGAALELWVEREFLARQRLERIHPEPSAMAFGDGRFRYRFDVADPAGPFEIDLLLHPERTGRLQGRLGVGTESVAVDQYVLP
jgi:hypothetical protein